MNAKTDTLPPDAARLGDTHLRIEILAPGEAFVRLGSAYPADPHHVPLAAQPWTFRPSGPGFGSSAFGQVVAGRTYAHLHHLQAFVGAVHAHWLTGEDDADRIDALTATGNRAVAALGDDE